MEIGKSFKRKHWASPQKDHLHELGRPAGVRAGAPYMGRGQLEERRSAKLEATRKPRHKGATCFVLGKKTKQSHLKITGKQVENHPKPL